MGNGISRSSELPPTVTEHSFSQICIVHNPIGISKSYGRDLSGDVMIYALCTDERIVSLSNRTLIVLRIHEFRLRALCGRCTDSYSFQK